MAQDVDLVFLRSAVTCGVLDAAQARHVVEAVAKVRELGASASAQEIAVNRGFLTASQAEQVAASSGLTERPTTRRTDRVGNYRLVEKIGVGGMGVVYRARQLTMDRDVALKILPPRLATDPVFVERFVREARSAARLNHPNIVQGIDVGAADGLYYFAMELVEGEDLKSRIERQGRLSEADALEVALQIARALEHANSHNIVHRDIKPDNILVADDGSVKLADLGLAKRQSDASLTQQLTALGTPLYMSPEQARGTADIDTRTDIYALGATLYHAVVGRPPFLGANATEIITKHLFDAPQSPREAVPELSEGFCRVLAKMLRKRPEARHQSPTELLADLERLAAGRPPVRSATRTPTTPVRRARRRRRRSPLVPIFVTTALFILAAGTWLLYEGLASANEQAHAGPAPRAAPSVRLRASAPPARPAKPPKPTSRAPDRAAAELRRVRTWIDAHPDDPDGALRRLRRLPQAPPGSQAAAEARHAIAAAEERRAAKDREGLLAACHEGKRLAAADRFAAAVELLDKFAAANHRLAGEVAEERGFLLSQAARAERELRVEAGRLAERGDFPAAIRCFERIAAFGIPQFAARARREIRLLEGRRTERDRAARGAADRAFLALRIQVAELLKARRWGPARAALTTALADAVLEPVRAQVEAEVQALDLLDALWAAAEAGARALRPGERFSVGGIGGTFERFAEGAVHIRASRIVRSKRLEDLTTNEIIDLARRKLAPDAPATHAAVGLFLLAEGRPDRAKEAFLRAQRAGADARYLDLIERQRADATEANAQAALRQATDATRAGRWKEAAELLGKLEKEYGDTHTFACHRETFGDLALEARLHTLTVADLFRGRCRVVGNGRHVELTYDFTQPEQLADWLLLGSEWSLGSAGHLTVRGAAAVLRAPVLRDVQGTVELAALPGPGGEWGVFLSEPEARQACYTVMLPQRPGLKAALCVARRPVAHVPLLMRPKQPRRVSIVLRDRRLSGLIDARELATWTDQRKAVPPELAFGVGAKGARAVRIDSVRLVATLPDKWVDEELERMGLRLHRRHKLGKQPWRRLFDGAAVAPWRPEHGPWEVRDGTLAATFAGSAALRKTEQADLQWRVKVRPQRRDSAVRLSVRVGRNGKRYALGLGGRPEHCCLTLGRDGAGGADAEVLARYAERVDWQAARWYDLHIVAVGSELRAELDGALLCLVHDRRLARGWLSLDVLHGGAAFKDISLRALD